MNKAKVVLLLLLFGATFMEARSQNSRLSERSALNYNEADYYYTLIEATKQYLINRNIEAVNLYYECLKYKPQSAAVNFQMSQIFLDAGDIRRAGEFALKAFESDRTNKWYLLNLVNIYQNTNQVDSAIILMELLIKMEPNGLEYKYLVTNFYERQGEYDLALKYLNEVELQAGISKEIILSKYRNYRLSGKEQEALRELKRASDYFGDDYNIDGMMAEFYRDNNEMDSARRYYEKIVPIHLENPDVAFSYSEFLLKMGRIDSASRVLLGAISSNTIDRRVKESYFLQVLQDDDMFDKLGGMSDTLSKVLLLMYPEEINVQSIYADVQMRNGNLEDASAMLKTIFENDKTNFIAIEQLIFVESSLGRTDSVIKYASQAVDLFTSRPVSYLFLGSEYYQRQNYNMALTILQRGERYTVAGSMKLQLFSLMAENYYAIALYDSTWNYFSKALQIDENNVVIKNNYAYYLAEQNIRLKEAEKMSEYTLNIDPENATFLDTYAWILFRMNKAKKAKRIIERAIDSNVGRDAEILDHYGDILFVLGKYRESLACWNEALDIDPGKKNDIIPKIESATEKVR